MFYNPVYPINVDTKLISKSDRNPTLAQCGSQATPGTEQDGTPNPHYCSYCYQGGAFTNDFTMEQMIAFCAPIMSEGNPGMTSQQATAQMQQFFPMLLRWKK